MPEHDLERVINELAESPKLSRSTDRGPGASATELSRRKVSGLEAGHAQPQGGSGITKMVHQERRDERVSESISERT
jgi:hypothetical protein